MGTNTKVAGKMERRKARALRHSQVEKYSKDIS